MVSGVIHGMVDLMEVRAAFGEGDLRVIGLEEYVKLSKLVILCGGRKQDEVLRIYQLDCRAFMRLGSRGTSEEALSILPEQLDPRHMQAYVPLHQVVEKKILPGRFRTNAMQLEDVGEDNLIATKDQEIARLKAEIAEMKATHFQELREKELAMAQLHKEFSGELFKARCEIGKLKSGEW
ncbi:hypothetical protein BBO99_00004244 [Phytophthora kernoviae]|uniref:Uncharacterized protein n=2 Tax=Phytophthora kernoviae TaxID=325452 RepID=A0A3R7G679_9STRA|nr:hypothetical protein G195_005822 [Phytophthora kernoviae 00238/432]KAG2522944.1 hypothetical protein JM16_005587 [Phytophthora kernoviae]KAG2524556.1 hypothetical protein JM18_005323 [Phytophthora kernoviae]RLN37997.1 hypothetical protein BBI17_002314 [Phytophthora kernoviae]RLN80783.1 hypothetical protein BBO99_00004244 [Phytophthora kernoviae]